MTRHFCAHVLTVHELFDEPTPIEPEPGTVWAGEVPMRRERTGRWICPGCGLRGNVGEEPQNEYKDIVYMFHG